MKINRPLRTNRLSASAHRLSPLLVCPAPALVGPGKIKSARPKAKRVRLTFPQTVAAAVVDLPALRLASERVVIVHLLKRMMMLGAGFNFAATLLGFSPSTLHGWCRAYDEAGFEGVLKRSTRAHAPRATGYQLIVLKPI